MHPELINAESNLQYSLFFISPLDNCLVILLQTLSDILVERKATTFAQFNVFLMKYQIVKASYFLELSLKYIVSPLHLQRYKGNALITVGR